MSFHDGFRYQSVTPARHSMYLLFIGIVTLITHERSLHNYELCWLDIPLR